MRETWASFVAVLIIKSHGEVMGGQLQPLASPEPLMTERNEESGYENELP